MQKGCTIFVKGNSNIYGESVQEGNGLTLAKTDLPRLYL